MSRRQRFVRKVSLRAWRLLNPLARSLAGTLPFWVVLETRGRRSGIPRQTPLARGPIDGDVAWLICVHGRHSAYAKNIEADPRVRLKTGRRWREGVASLHRYDPQIASRFSLYARLGPTSLGIDPLLVRVDLDPA